MLIKNIYKKFILFLVFNTCFIFSSPTETMLCLDDTNESRVSKDSANGEFVKDASIVLIATSIVGGLLAAPWVGYYYVDKHLHKKEKMLARLYIQNYDSLMWRLKELIRMRSNYYVKYRINRTKLYQTYCTPEQAAELISLSRYKAGWAILGGLACTFYTLLFIEGISTLLKKGSENKRHIDTK